jgi:hypothetical protein
MLSNPKDRGDKGRQGCLSHARFVVVSAYSRELSHTDHRMLSTDRRVSAGAYIPDDLIHSTALFAKKIAHLSGRLQGRVQAITRINEFSR